MPGLRLQTPMARDYLMMLAGASDARAQRWLGWRPESIVPEKRRERLMTSRPGRGRLLRQPDQQGGWRLIAVNPDDGQLAGATWCDENTGEIGGSLVPGYRGRGLGTSLFAGLAQFTHQHLGIARVFARTERDNAPCIGALTRAGFTLTSETGTHTLPDGRVVPVLRFRHEAEPSCC